MVGTESRNRNLAQKSHVSRDEKLEKLFRKRSKGTIVALGNDFGEDEIVFAMDIDMPVLFRCYSHANIATNDNPAKCRNLAGLPLYLNDALENS